MDHSDDVEASLAFYCARDDDQLEAFYDGRMSFRRLWVLVSKMPPDSPLGIALAGGPEEAVWTPELQILDKLSLELQTFAHVFGETKKEHFKGKKNPIPAPKSVRETIGNQAKAARHGKIVFGGKNPSPRAELEQVLGKPKLQEGGDHG